MKSVILVVDDEPVARQSLSDILRLEGFSVNAVPNGQAAVEYVRTHSVDLMVVDLRMPGMDGLEVIQVVNQVSPDTEVILLTAHGSMESAVQALRLRIHDYLSKPAAPHQILASVKKGLARREARVKERGLPGLAADEAVSEFRFRDGAVADLSRRTIRKGRKEAHLTPAEGRLLRVLLENPGRVFSHRDLVLLVQGYDTSPQEAPEVLRPLVSRLRHKLEDFPDLMKRISSVRGTGYVYEENGN